MKGVIFVELVNFIEDSFGMELADRVLSNTTLASGGAYTSVGTYASSEAFAIVESVAAESNLPASDLLRTFGEHLFSRLVAGHPEFLVAVDGPITMLRQIEHHIHVEVRKLYPDAELPHFTYEPSGPDELVMVYRSSRGLADLCEGLIRGCYAYFGKPILLTRQPLPGRTGTAARFHVKEG